VTATPAERTARLARLGRIGVWLLLAGGLLDVVIVAAWLAAAPPGAGLGGLLAGPLGRPERPFALGLLGGTVVGLAGLGLYVVVPGFDPSLAKRELDRPSAILASLAAVVVLGIVLPLPLIYLTVGPRPPSPLPPPALAAALIGSSGGMMVVLIWRVVRPGAITWADMGLTTDHLGRRMAQGAVGGLIIFVLAQIVALVVSSFGIEQTQLAQFRAIRGAGPSQFLGLWLLAAVAAPICEETFFRGYIFTALRQRYGRPLAYLGSSLLFAALHLNLPALAPIVVMALGVALLYDRSRSVVPGIVAHGLNNAVALIVIAAYGRFGG
jgi:membrane protease YdiL (CAAX protease family)